MNRRTIIAALLCGAPASLSVPAAAQELPQAQHDRREAIEPNAQAKIELLEAQVEALQEALEGIKAHLAATTPSWKGAPQVVDKEAGWSFKPRGRLMYDFATVGSPDGFDNAGLGFSNEVRRARLGVEGTVPGGFGYKFELDFAAGEVEFSDAFLSYGKGPLEFIVGHHNNFQSLDELTSSLHSSFIERAAFTDAFGFERRVGASVQFQGRFHRPGRSVYRQHQRPQCGRRRQ